MYGNLVSNFSFQECDGTTKNVKNQSREKNQWDDKRENFDLKTIKLYMNKLKYALIHENIMYV